MSVNGCFREHTSSDFISLLVHSCPFIHLRTPPLKSVGYYGIPSVQKFELSVCPSVTISFPLSILSIFQPILFKLYIRDDIGEE